MRNIPCISLLIIFFNVYCLNGFAADGDLKKYYFFSHKAEHLFLNKFYSQSLECYDSSFKYKIHPFASDINNALFCCLISKNYEKALMYSILLVGKGATLEYFNQAAFSEFNTSPYGKDFQNRFKTVREDHLKRINQQIRNEIVRLVKADQQTHCQLPSKSSDSTYVLGMHISDETNYKRLEELLSVYDYLDEEVIGANFVSDTILSITPIYGPIVIHNIQKSGTAIITKIQEAVKNGKVNSICVANWLGFARFPELNVARGYRIYLDTLWKLKECYRDQQLYRMFTKQDALKIDSILNFFYINDVYFKIEERIVYNFRNIKSKVGFAVLPSALVIESVEQKSISQFLEDLHNSYFPFDFH